MKNYFAIPQALTAKEKQNFTLRKMKKRKFIAENCPTLCLGPWISITKQGPPTGWDMSSLEIEESIRKSSSPTSEELEYLNAME